ncbi:MAG: hypothetical protein ACLQKA_03905 [Bryobacteraceae bacterium]
MMRQAAVAARVEQRRTRIKILNGPTMICDAEGCHGKAAYLFREEDGPIAAYCKVHGDESASRAGIPLPTSKITILRSMPIGAMATRLVS